MLGKHPSQSSVSAWELPPLCQASLARRESQKDFFLGFGCLPKALWAQAIPRPPKPLKNVDAGFRVFCSGVCPTHVTLLANARRLFGRLGVCLRISCLCPALSGVWLQEGTIDKSIQSMFAQRPLAWDMSDLLTWVFIMLGQPLDFWKPFPCPEGCFVGMGKGQSSFPLVMPAHDLELAWTTSKIIR